MTKIVSLIKLIIVFCIVPQIASGQHSRPPGQAKPLENQYIKPIEMAGVIKSIKSNWKYREKNDIHSPLVSGGNEQTSFYRSGLVKEFKTMDADNKLISHCSLSYNDSLTQFVKTYHIGRYGSNYVLPLEIWESDSVCWQIDTVSKKIVAKYEYTKGVIQKLINYGGDTSIIERLDLFDSLGNRIYKEENILSMSFHTKEYWKYTYDERGNILTCLKTNNDGSAVIEDQRYTYDKLNRKLTYSYVGVDWDAFTTYEYNARGDLKLAVTTGSNPEANQRTVYSYDKYGNRISEVIFVGEIDISRKTWTISYFE